MKKTTSANSLLQLVLAGTLSFFIFSCSRNHEQDAFTEMNKPSFVQPRITLLANLPDSSKPKETRLADMPKPLTISFPATPGSSYTLKSQTGPVKINLVKPVTHYFIDTLTHLPVAPDAQFTGFFTNFTTDHGLALDGILCSMMDKSGNLWFGTDGAGVSCYDGRSFTTLKTIQGLQNNTVYCITTDKSGNIWMGTREGVSSYDGRSYTNYSTRQGLVNNIVRCMILDKQGNLWLGTDGGVSRFDGKSFTNFTAREGLAENNVRSIAEDRSGNLWFGTYNCGISRFDGKAFSTFTINDRLASNSVRAIIQDKSGNIWFGTDRGGVSRYDGKTFTSYTTREGLADNFIRTITEDRSGNLWFGTYRGGVSRYDGKSFSNFTTGQGLPNNAVLSITEDKSGNLWFGTFGGGIARYEGRSFTHFKTREIPGDYLIMSIFEDNSGNTWFGNEGGVVSRYDGKSFTNYTIHQGFSNYSVNRILQDKAGKLWFGTNYGGLLCFDGKSCIHFTTSQGLADNSVWSIFIDKSGNLWIGTEKGISCYDGNSFINYTTAQGLADNSVWSIIQDKRDNLWFGTYGGGVSRYDGRSFITFTTLHGLASNTIFNITEDKSGNLWFCTEEGLSLLTEEKSARISEDLNGKEVYSSQLFESYSTKNGLPDNFVTQVVPYDDDKLYIGTNNGLCELLREDPGKERAKGWQTGKIFNSMTGYPVKDVNVWQGMFKDRKGIIWIGTGATKARLVRFDPKETVKPNPVPPILIIQSIKINNENISWYDLKSLPDSAGWPLKSDSNVTAPNITEEVSTFGKPLSEEEREILRQKFGDITFTGIGKWYPVPENLVLPYRHNNITFEFNAIETSSNQMVKYTYMLEGYDKDWSPPGNKTSAGFGNMYEGTYTFKLKAQSPGGVWTDPVTYTFNVLPPWWRTWWMYVIYGMMAAGSVALIVWWNGRRLRAKAKKLETEVDKATIVIRNQKEIVEAEKKKSDELLLNILPSEVAEELKQTGHCQAKTFSMVTVMFADFKDFTSVSEKVSAELLVGEINFCFSAFDHILLKYKVEKIKTVGDAYICASGLPVLSYTHAFDLVSAALEIRNFMLARKHEKEARGEIPFELRIGIHTGPVVAGIVGVKKFQYDIWGDTVNLAARMESSGEAGQVNISGTTYALVKDKFTCTYRGKIKAKNKGEIDMYFVDKDTL